MKVTASLPSKCFVLGEYLALDTGRALIANTSPRFLMHLETRGSGACLGIHPQSPAGQFIKANEAVFRSVNLSFEDAHRGQGGFGASSAQFVASFFLKHILESKDLKFNSSDLSRELLQQYLSSVHVDGGRRPSGADVLAQFHGGLAAVDLESATTVNTSWPFKEYSFLLVRTGQKLATHEHLAKINGSSFKALQADFDRAMKSLEAADAKTFAEAVTAYQVRLADMGLLSAVSKNLLGSIEDSGLFFTQKACGAMGADVIFVMFQKSKTQDVVDFFGGLNLQIVADEECLSPGLEIRTIPNPELTKGPWL